MRDFSDIRDRRFRSLTSRDTRLDEVPIFVGWSIGLSDDETSLFIGIEVLIIEREKSSDLYQVDLHCLYDSLRDFRSDKCLLWNDHLSFRIDDIFESDTIDQGFLIIFHAMRDDTKWCRDKSVFIHFRIRSEVKYETDIWSFWCRDRTYTTILCRVYISHFE